MTWLGRDADPRSRVRAMDDHRRWWPCQTFSQIGISPFVASDMKGRGAQTIVETMYLNVL